MRVLVTGAGGFIGRSVCARLVTAGHEVRGTFRRRPGAGTAVGEWQRLDLADPAGDPHACCRSMDAVVHLAAHVHVRGAARLLRPDRFRQVNVAGTEALVRAAGEAGVRRFLFLSSIGVNGAASPIVNGVPRRFRDDDAPAPLGAYARSKYEAERVLGRLPPGPGMTIATLRAPLVFGPGVGANFLALLRWIRSGLPVPVRAQPVQRSMMYVENLADLVTACVAAPEPVAGVRVIRDFDYGIADLVARIAAAMQRPARLRPLPERFVDAAIHLPVLGGALARLTQSLLIDDGRIRSELRWSPGVDAGTAIARTVESFLRGEQRRSA